jgi:DNA-directed RNA polymerase specialized sigma24 family protein
MSSQPRQDVDPALREYLRAPEDAADEALGALLSGDADRTIRGIVARTLGGPRPGRNELIEAEDVRSDVRLQLVARLRALRSGRQPDPIANFAAYVASVTYRTCYTHLRRAYPERARLKNRVRYALAGDPDVTLEPAPGGVWRCLLTSWVSTPPAPDLPAMQRFRQDPARFGADLLPDPAGAGLGVPDTVKILLGQLGQAIEFDLLVDAVAGMLGVADQPMLRVAEDADSAADRLADPRASAATSMAQRQYVARLWNEIRELPPNQRAAVLLNLRDDDGQSALPILPLIGIATIRQIAEALGMAAAELAAIWRDLPIEDARIAARLGLTRQQVINLRKSARDRLGRRMAPLGGVAAVW